VTALIGPSGCGKSTFLRCINRMNDLIDAARVEGELLLRGKNVYDDDVDPVALRRRVGMVFQEPDPFSKSIRENVAYGLKVQDFDGDIDARVEQALKNAAPWDEVNDRLGSSGLDLSGGQQQRLCIARAVAADPEVILMDEPASALDPIATSKVEDLIDDLAEEYTVVVTHDMQQAARISDRTAVFLTGGELVEVDDTETIFENPESERVENYITGTFGRVGPVALAPLSSPSPDSSRRTPGAPRHTSDSGRGRAVHTRRHTPHRGPHRSPRGPPRPSSPAPST